MEPYLSEIRVFSFGNIPRGWLACNGQILAINTNQALFALLGTNYGGNGTTTFGIPNLQGAVMMGYGNGGGGQYNYGQVGGVENVTLLTTQIPAHNHIANAQKTAATSVVPVTTGSAYLAQPVITNGGQQVNLYSTTTPPNPAVILSANQIGTTGGSTPHSNMPPYNIFNVCICTSGIFPSRN